MCFDLCVLFPFVLSLSKHTNGCLSGIAHRAYREKNVHNMREFGCSSGRMFERKGMEGV